MFDADGVVSQLLTRENVCEKLQKVFGDESIDASGLINRAFIREQVFDSAEQRAKLESILHPEVKNEFDTVVEKTSGFDDGILFADIPLLYESSCEFKCDAVFRCDGKLNKATADKNVCVYNFTIFSKLAYCNEFK